MLQQPDAHDIMQAFETAIKCIKSEIDVTLDKVVIANDVEEKQDQYSIEYVINGAHVLNLEQSGQVRFAKRKHFIWQTTTLLFLLLLLFLFLIVVLL
ncbi:Cks85A [Drosophila busckii]|uniref:Cks85A n=1 Tax=Drosophila busckii TaxID=30019 RepID=A0A0M5JD50_DROBS|nr:Cks85A [Drosophila busckii]